MVNLIGNIRSKKKHPKIQIFAKKNDRVRGINFDSIFGVIAHFFCEMVSELAS